MPLRLARERSPKKQSRPRCRHNSHPSQEAPHWRGRCGDIAASRTLTKSPGEVRDFLRRVILVAEEIAPGTAAGVVIVSTLTARRAEQSAESAAALVRAAGYGERNVERMESALVADEGLPIGGPIIEAACKNVIKQWRMPAMPPGTARSGHLLRPGQSSLQIIVNDTEPASKPLRPALRISPRRRYEELISLT